MQVNITQQPDDFQPVKSDGLFFVVSADTQSVYNFRYIFEVYVQGLKIFTGKSTPNPYGLGILDVSKVMETYLTGSPVALDEDTAIFWHSTFPFSRPYSNQVLDYYILVGEEHSTTPTGVIEQYSGIGSSLGSPSVPSLDFRSYLGTLPVNYIANTQDFNYGPFVMSGFPSNYQQGLFLTNSPRQRELTENDYFTLSFTNYRVNNEFVYSEPYYGTINFYDDIGGLITGLTFTNIWSNGGGPLSSCTNNYPVVLPAGYRASDYNIMNFGVGPKNLPVIPNGTQYYEVALYGVRNNILVTPTPTSSVTPTPSFTPSPTPSGPACNEYLVENLTAGPITESITECDGTVVNLTLGAGDFAGVCVTTIPPSSFNWILQGACPPACLCLDVTFTNTVARSEILYYKDCNENIVALTIAPLGVFNTCICNFFSWTGSTFTIVNNGPCSFPTPTATPTPTSTPVPGINALLRSCCDPSQQIYARIDGRAVLGTAVAYNGECYTYIQSTSFYNIDLTENTSFNSCQECQATYPCADQEDLSVLKPDIEPILNVPSLAGEGSCVAYQRCSEIFTFNLVCNEGAQFAELQLMFRNRYGVYDYFRFQRGKAEGLGIERQTYQQYNQTWGQENVLKTTYSRGTTNWQTRVTETHVINSGFISQSEMVYLQELFTSDDVYEIKHNGGLFPINIANAEFIIKSKGNKDLVNLELTYVYSNNIRMLGL